MFGTSSTALPHRPNRPLRPLRPPHPPALHPPRPEPPPPPAPPAASARPAPAPRRTVHLSARTGQGLDRLRRILLEVAGWQSVPEGICIARARHVQALQMAAAHLEQAADQLQARGAALELLAEELRLAQNALDSITG